MSIFGSLNIGRTALTAAQVGIQTTGNNVANVNTPGYSRQTVSLASLQDQRWGNNFVGRGVEVQGIRRQVDEALQQRLRNGNSSENAAGTDLRLASGVEDVLNIAGSDNLNSRLGQFFNAWSELANRPAEPGTRSLVVQQGRQLASYVQGLRSSLEDQRTGIDRDLAATATRANQLLDQVGALNAQIVLAENGQGQANNLRDQRDAILTELSRSLNITTIDRGNGATDVLIGSTPIVLAGVSRGIELRQTANGATTRVDLVTKDQREVLPVTSGTLGSLLANRSTLVDSTIESVDNLAAQLIFEVNRLHSTGSSGLPASDVTGGLAVRSTDLGLAINDPASETFATRRAKPTSGTFDITVRNTVTGSSQTARIRVDLDGINNAGALGTADDTSVNTLVSSINATGVGVTATVTADGRLRVTVPAGYSVGFSEDTSGVLAALEVNSYFSGGDASTIAVRQGLVDQPSLLAAGRVEKGAPTENGTALAVAQLRDKRLANLADSTFSGAFNRAGQAIAVTAGSAKTNAEATRAVRESLDAQRAAIAGVSLDEEAINLVGYQQMYQASARYVSVVNDLTQTLLQLV